jgi:hypothetical protein
LADELCDVLGPIIWAGLAYKPDPERVTRETLPATLTLSVPLALFATVGAKATYTSQWAPGVRTPFQVAVARQ